MSVRFKQLTSKNGYKKELLHKDKWLVWLSKNERYVKYSSEQKAVRVWMDLLLADTAMERFNKMCSLYEKHMVEQINQDSILLKMLRETKEPTPMVFRMETPGVNNARNRAKRMRRKLKR